MVALLRRVGRQSGHTVMAAMERGISAAAHRWLLPWTLGRGPSSVDGRRRPRRFFQMRGPTGPGNEHMAGATHQRLGTGS